MMIYFIFVVLIIFDIILCIGENFNKRLRYKNMKDFIIKDKFFCL